MTSLIALINLYLYERYSECVHCEHTHTHTHTHTQHTLRQFMECEIPDVV
jgi:hypothetical protein